MFCQKCGTENDDSAVFCNKCGAAMNGAGKKEAATVVEARAPKKGIAIALVAILLVAGCGLAFWHFGNGGDNSATFTPTDGTFVLKDTGSTNYDQDVLYKGTVTVTLENGHMNYSMNLDKIDVAKEGITLSPTVIKRYTTWTESNNTPLWPNYSPMKDMKECFAFLNGYTTTSIMCTFSDGSTEVDAYKFVYSDRTRSIYVSTDGVIYQWCQAVDDVSMSFILDGWTRTSNYNGYHC